MKGIQRIIHFLLALVMVLHAVSPMAVRADETFVTDAVTENPASAEAAMVLQEETVVSTETMTESAAEPVVSTEPVAEPAESVAEIIVTDSASQNLSRGAGEISGTCGDNLTWILDDAGTLTISGTGDMDDFADGSSMPWYDHISSITSVVLEAGVTDIGNYAFNGCTALISVTIPDSVRYIDFRAFAGCTSLTGVTIPEGVKSIGSAAFEECSALTSIRIPSSVTGIGNYAFYKCGSLTSVTIPEGMTSISQCAFGHCSSLTEVNIPGSVTEIEDFAFTDCTSLTSVTIPEKVTLVGTQAFYGCTGLREITFQGDMPTFGTSVFSRVTATAGYPADNDTWAEDKLQNYGGTITWVSYGVCENGHTEVIDEAVAATCTESGLTEGSHCSVCGAILAAQEVIEPAGHRYEAVYTSPNFDADGFTTYTCSACGDTYTETDEGTMKTAAASIGSVKYETLAEAFAAATEGDTILMLKTYTITKGTVETWDLSGKTLEVSGNRGGIHVEGTLTVLGGTFRFLEGAQGLMVWEDGQVTIENGTFHTVNSRGIWAVYGKVTFNGGTFYITGEGYIGTSDRQVGSNAFAQFLINGGTFHFRDQGCFADYGNSTIKGGTFYLESFGGTIRAGYSYHRDSLTITGGTFYISGAVGLWVDPAKGHLIIRGGQFITTADSAQILQYDGGTLGIYSGTFSQDMTPYLSSNYCCRKSGAYYVVGTHVYTLKNTSEAYLKTEADCTNPAEYYWSCPCGKAGTDTFTNGDPLGHSFTNYVSNDNATCTENGTETASCNRACGTTDEREIPDSAKGHSYQDGICTECGDENRCGDNLFWEFDADTGTLTIFGTGAMENYLNSELTPWCAYAEQIRAVVIETGVTSVGSSAFSGCGELESIVIPIGVTSIGGAAFSGCGNLKNVVLPDSVTCIGNWAFSDCGSLTDFTVPKNVTDIGNYVFYNCSSLTGVTLPEGITNMGAMLFCGCSKLVSVTIPENVITIERSAFSNCSSLTDIVIPDSVVNFGDLVFSQCIGLQVINFLGDAPSFGNNVFNGVTATAYYPANNDTWTEDKLQNYGGTITWEPYGVTSIIASGTCGENLTWILDEDGVLTITGTGDMDTYTDSATAPWYGYADQIQAVILEDGITKIGGFAFYNCTAMRSVFIPDSVSKIGTKAFFVCKKLEAVAVPAGVTELASAVFSGCTSLSDVKLPDGLKTIGSGAFASCQSLREIHIPNQVTYIYTRAFSGCTSLVSVTIPSRVATLGCYAFEKCTALESVTFAEGVQTIAYNAFENCTNLTEVHLPESLTMIEEEVFYKCSSLRSISIPAKVTTIGDSAFHRCDGLESVTFHYGLKSIGSEAFRGCSRLTELNIPGSVTKLGTFAFADCTGLTSVTLPGRISSIGNGAFHSCFGLTSAKLAEGIRVIGAQAFQNCRELKSVEFPESLETIEKYVFQDCISLESVNFPASVVKVDDDAFMSCTALSTVTFQGDAPVLVNGCFRYVCATVYYPGANPTWTESIMEDYGGTLTWEPYGAVENRVTLDAADLAGQGTVWIDGVEYALQVKGDSCYVDLPDGNARTVTAYTCYAGDASDIHTQYPVSMQVWTLENEDGIYTATHLDAFDDILCYSGMSIRVNGKQGIRMITSIDKAKKSSLISDGLAGYTLKEYGTVVAWASQLDGGNPLILGQSYAKSSYAYKKGIADPVFAYDGDRMQYTNVLVGFGLDQCREDLAMRPYMILTDAAGNEITLYGGIVQRSIGYIAAQNANTFDPVTEADAYNYVWDIIHHVYGEEDVPKAA